MDAVNKTYAGELTSTQKGAIGEAFIGAQLMLASNGRLSPFRSIADDATGRAAPRDLCDCCKAARQPSVDPSQKLFPIEC
jgi:hypothetical protein